MALFFLFAAFLFVPGLQADDAGPYGNYSGICSLRPMNVYKQAYMMCIPNKARAFEFGDYFYFGSIHPNGATTLKFSLLNERFSAIYKATIRLEQKTIHIQGDTVFDQGQIYNYKGPFEGDRLYHKLSNGPDGIQFTINDLGTPEIFKYRHRVANPGSAYKYLHIEKSTSFEIRVVNFNSPTIISGANNERIGFTENQWNGGRGKFY